ncbi:MAG TPA: PQQ-dependent dehydrogenase, methanol/ethanol family [Methylomirabilota bacterium]|jgi:alcohol dehydrogenase (cytochrome c)|nr:PQQ-dependent dehydrogenase, methanol/ethanol family [Methylomirabilota bacterium]
MDRKTSLLLSFGSLVFVVLVVLAPAPAPGQEWTDVTEARLLDADKDGNNWLTYRRTYNGWWYSPLTQINTSNVGKLTPKWIFSGGGWGDQKGTPLVNNGIMFTVSTDATDPTAHPRTIHRQKVFAVDAATGVALWKHEHKLPEDLTALVRVLVGTRGLALWKDKVYYGTYDARLIALRAKTGEVAWNKEITDYRDGYFVSMAPLIVKGKVIVGMAGPGEMGPRGFIEAFDSETGASLWRTYTVPGPGEPGNNTWPGETWKLGGAAAWNHGTYDPETNLVFFGTGNPAPWIPQMRQGDNLFANSVIALDTDTGKIKWHFQILPNDPWDFDTPQEPLVIDVVRNGRTVKSVVQANKLGFVYTLERTNGKFMSAVPFVNLINWGQVDPATGRAAKDNSKIPEMGGQRVEVCPGLVGATSWGSKPYSPRTGYLYIPANEYCMMYGFRGELAYKRGAFYTGAIHDHHAKGDQSGVLRAFDVNTNRIVWEWSNRSPLISFALATGGDLVFVGTPEGKVVGLNARTGQQLWEFNVGTPVSGGIVSYSVGGKQYVAVAAGGTTRSTAWFGKEPRWQHLFKNVNWGDSIVVFGLPE